MNTSRQVGDIDVELSLKMQILERRFEIAAWCIGALIILGALLGLSGSGLLSHGFQQSNDGKLKLTFPRFGRTQALETMTFEIDRSFIQNGEISIIPFNS